MKLTELLLHPLFRKRAGIFMSHILMPVMDVGHVTMLVLDARMLVFMRVSHDRDIMPVELIMAMSVLVQDRHMDVEMGMLFICQ